MQDYVIKYVALYLRKSRGDSEDDLEKHKMILVELCKQNNWKYVEYYEIGTSDSIDLRPKMLKLLSEVESELYDAVCVVDYDRLGRGDMGEQDRIKKVFQRSNTLIVTPSKIIDLNSEADDTYADFQGLCARYEYKQICKRLRQGKKMGAKRGQWTNGTAPYPYEYQRYGRKYNEKGLVVNDEKLSVYRRIIDSLVSGKPPAEIAAELNRDKIPSPRGMLWSGVTVYRMGIDETHLGRIISNKSQGDGHKVKKSNAKPVTKNASTEWIIIENCHEAVKTREEHEHILNWLNERKITPLRTRQSVYALSGLVKCGLCGHTHTFLTKPKNNLVLMKPCWYKDPYGAKCSNKGIMASMLESLIFEEVSRFRENMSLTDESEEKALTVQLNAQISDKENQLKKYVKAIERIQESFELGDYSREEWRKAQNKWELEIKKTNDDLFELKSRLRSTQTYDRNERCENIDYYLNTIGDVATPKERNELLKTIISKIIWKRTEDKAEIQIIYK